MPLPSSSSPRWPKAGPWLGGIGFTVIIALLGWALVQIPGLDRLGQLGWAIIIAVIYRHIWGYPEKLRPGIQFAAKRLLRVAIILFGLQLNIQIIFQQGLGLLAKDIVTILISIGVMMFLAKLFRADKSLSLLLGVGTGVCGAAAIAAISPILKAKDEDTAMGVGIIALVGTIFAIGYTFLWPLLPLTPAEYGTWTGISLHEIAHVALAGAPAGSNALAVALLGKLGRVFLLVPLCLILLGWMKVKHRHESNDASSIEFPWFLLGFILLSIFGSYVVGDVLPVSTGVMDGISFGTTFLLTMAMIGLGLNIHFRNLRQKALRPLLAMFLTSILLSVLTYFIV